MDNLRTTLQPIMRSLPAPIRDMGLSLIGPDCYKSLILDIDIANTSCLTLALSKTLGLATVAGSSIVKLPQILKLLSSQSAAGISFLSYALETSSFLTTLAYSARNGFPFSTYGETAMIAVQNIVICLLVLKFQGKTVLAGGFLGALLAGVYALQCEGLVFMVMLTKPQMGAGALGVASKVPQILTIWQQGGGTGQLSAFAVFNYLIGSMTRIFTTLKEVDDNVILYGYIAGFILNAVLAAQMIYYWKAPATASHAVEMGEKPEKVAMGSSTGATPKPKGPTTRRRG
ncbi:hypothetical protein N7G274_007165 [Stereocaulon virgatum]|uniref:Mannose-P-dolichol utilization defect 1 protein homolog n=1 Tax=Stereocaulon virgatum TaxID=373712 RepID=A0ABR4A790_9LECA